MEERGFATGGFTSNVNASSFYNLDQGFETFLEVWKERGRHPGKKDAEIVNLEIGRWIESLEDDEPFFLFANYIEPHLPSLERLRKPSRDRTSSARHHAGLFWNGARPRSSPHRSLRTKGCGSCKALHPSQMRSLPAKAAM